MKLVRCRRKIVVAISLQRQTQQTVQVGTRARLHALSASDSIRAFRCCRCCCPPWGPPGAARRLAGPPASMRRWLAAGGRALGAPCRGALLALLALLALEALAPAAATCVKPGAGGVYCNGKNPDADVRALRGCIYTAGLVLPLYACRCVTAPLPRASCPTPLPPSLVLAERASPSAHVHGRGGGAARAAVSTRVTRRVGPLTFFGWDQSGESVVSIHAG